MYPRTEYEMTEADLAAILAACKPTPAMMIGGFAASSVQENANRAWASLGQKMGFDPMTVRPTGRGDRFFSAVPSETPEQRTRRLKAEAASKIAQRAAQLENEIATRRQELAALRSSSEAAS